MDGFSEIIPYKLGFIAGKFVFQPAMFDIKHGSLGCGKFMEIHRGDFRQSMLDYQRINQEHIPFKTTESFFANFRCRTYDLNMCWLMVSLGSTVPPGPSLFPQKKVDIHVDSDLCRLCSLLVNFDLPSFSLRLMVDIVYKCI